MASFQLKDRLQAAERWILANPNPPQSWPWTWLYKVGRTAYAMARDVLSGQLTLHAMSLVYTTLLSIVPLLALSFSVLKNVVESQCQVVMAPQSSGGTPIFAALALLGM